ASVTQSLIDIVGECIDGFRALAGGDRASDIGRRSRRDVIILVAVEAVAAVHCVAASAAEESVVAGAAIEPIVAVIAEQPIVARAAVEDVVAVTGEKQVVGGVPEKTIVSVFAESPIVAG